MVVDDWQSRRMSYRLLLVLLWVNLVIFTIEAIAGWASQSLCLLAESLHTLADAFGAFLGLVAVANPRRPLGREIWGHGRGEVGSALLVAAILGAAGVGILGSALGQLRFTVFSAAGLAPAVQVTIPLMQLMAAMVAIALTLALLVGHQGRDLPGLALGLATQQVLHDGWLSLGTLLTLLGIWQGYSWLDALVAIALLIFLLRSFWRVLDRQLPMLLRPTAIAPEAVAQIVLQVDGVIRCNRIRSRGMVGRHVTVELYLAVHPEYLGMPRTISERVEAALRNYYGPVTAQVWIEQAY